MPASHVTRSRLVRNRSTSRKTTPRRPRTNRPTSERGGSGKGASERGGTAKGGSGKGAFGGSGGGVSTGRRKNPRLLGALLAQGPSYCESYFEVAGPEEVIQVFEESYSVSLVNLLLDLKKSTTKRLYEIVVRHKKRAFVNVFTLYYYKDYLTNPLPLSLESETGRHVPNHYAILGVPRDATLDELKTAHKLLSAAFGPDSFPPGERRVGEESLREINAAFEILKNSKQRKSLDESLPNISYLYPRRDQSWLSAVLRLTG